VTLLQARLDIIDSFIKTELPSAPAFSPAHLNAILNNTFSKSFFTLANKY
jgi:hypothetical protein